MMRIHFHRYRRDPLVRPFGATCARRTGLAWINREEAMKKFMTVMAAVIFAGFANAAQADEFFRSHLSGDEEVPPVGTRARGQIEIRANDAETQLHYELRVANIEDVTQAHIHLAPPGENGSVVLFLFGFIGEGVTRNGLLSATTRTTADLVGPLAGEPLSALIAEIRSGNAYVNVHTVDNPPGEIRGQLF